MNNCATGGIYEHIEEVCKSNNENFRLKTQLEKAVEALRFYADESHYRKECWDSRIGAIEEVIIDNGKIARIALKEITNDKRRI